MKKIYLYAGIGAWIILISLIVVALSGSTNSSKEKTLEPEHALNTTKIFKMQEAVTHPIDVDQNIAVNVKEANIVIDEKTPKACVLGSCIDDRKPGKYVLTVKMEITNLGKDLYTDSPYQFHIEDINGKRHSPASRQFDISTIQVNKGQTYDTKLIYDLDPPATSYSLVLTQYFGDKETRIKLNDLQKLRPDLCQGEAICFTGYVKKIIDGDTLDIVDVETQKIERLRLSLVDTPEKGEPLFQNAMDFTAGFCPVDSYVLFDEDDGQTEGSFDRKIGKLYCEGQLLNDKLLEHNLAVIDVRFCEKSEYGKESWATQNGCNI